MSTSDCRQTVFQQTGKSEDSHNTSPIIASTIVNRAFSPGVSKVFRQKHGHDYLWTLFQPFFFAVSQTSIVSHRENSVEYKDSNIVEMLETNELKAFELRSFSLEVVGPNGRKPRDLPILPAPPPPPGPPHMIRHSPALVPSPPRAAWHRRACPS